ncbi:MAG: hypothetical protein HDQ88_00065 [Clostridia bacterium]|nr:hypothetical protein [Clostridia bacterium]
MFKIKVKKGFLAIIIAVALLVSSFIPLISLTSLAYAESSPKLWTYADCICVLNFIEQNFEQFVTDYNQAFSETQLNASYIEYSSIINLVEDDNFGLYIDFNGDNGYAVMTGNYNIYELKVEGDLQTLKETEEVYYSYIDGFLYVDENNIYQRIFKDEQIPDNVSTQSTVYPGQQEPGDGEILSTKIKDYVAKRYPEFVYESTNVKLTSGFNYGLQSSTSYYVKVPCDKNGDKLSGSYNKTEENCSVTALYNVLRNWTKKSFISGIDYSSCTDIRETIKKDFYYILYGIKHIRTVPTSKSVLSGGDTDSEYYYWEPNYEGHLMSMPNLYSNLRWYAISKYGLSPEKGINIDNAMDVATYVAKNTYSADISLSKTDSVTTAINSIDSGKAVFISMQDSITYGSHAVVLIGYQKYTFKINLGSFTLNFYAYFYLVADGWNSNARYFDPNVNSPSLEFLVLN